MSALMCVVAENKLASSCYHYFLRLESGTWDVSIVTFQKSDGLPSQQIVYPVMC